MFDFSFVCNFGELWMFKCYGNYGCNCFDVFDGVLVFECVGFNIKI